MRLITRLAALALAAALQACATGPVQAPPPVTPGATVEAAAPVTVLVSIDGFRPDYLQLGITPNLSALATGGVTGPMRPSFPTKTFPNHWTIVTGLRPEHHGIIGNRMEAAERPGETFTMSSADPFWWGAATPIWIDAERAGIRTATMFWPGSNVDFGGVRPSAWQAFAKEVTDAQRVDAVVDWLRRPAATRPRFVTLYFDTVDTAGHQFGPDAPGTRAAVAAVDTEIGRMQREAAALGVPLNLVIVADHGMAAIAPERVIRLDRIADPKDYRSTEDGPYAALFAQPGREAALEAAILKPHAHMQCWRKADIPAALQFRASARIAPYLCLAEPGWLVVTREPNPNWTRGGAHGWAQSTPDMLALFVANGPAFRSGVTLPAFDNVDIEPLLRRVLGMPSDPSVDGTAATFTSALAN